MFFKFSSLSNVRCLVRISANILKKRSTVVWVQGIAKSVEARVYTSEFVFLDPYHHSTIDISLLFTCGSFSRGMLERLLSSFVILLSSNALFDSSNLLRYASKGSSGCEFGRSLPDEDEAATWQWPAIAWRVSQVCLINSYKLNKWFTKT